MQQPLTEELRMTEKKCSRCDEVKPLSEFYKTSRAVDGFNWACKPCHLKLTHRTRARLHARRREVPQSKVCADCQTEKPASEFSTNNNNVDTLSSFCRQCLKARKRKERYGLAPEDLERLLDEQEHRCAICKDTIGKSSHVDHDHESGAVRGILCPACNHGLGRFRDDPGLLEEAAEYIRVHLRRQAES